MKRASQPRNVWPAALVSIPRRRAKYTLASRIVKNPAGLWWYPGEGAVRGSPGSGTVETNEKPTCRAMP